MPPILKIWFEAIKSYWFWTILALLIAGGLSLQQMNSNNKLAVCATYGEFFEKGVNSSIAAKLDANTTAEVEKDVKNLFCQPDTEVSTGPHWPTLQDFKIVVPGSLILSVVLVSFLPLQAKRKDITQRVNDTTAVIEDSSQLAEVGASQDYMAKIASRYVQVAIAARQLRIAIFYAVLSGAATLLVHPLVAGLTPTGHSELEGNLGHMAAITLAAIVAALQGSFGFSRTSIKSARLALTLGFGSIFFGSLIAMCITIPYQVLRPLELHPMTSDQVLRLLCIRVLAIPAIAGITVFLLRPVLRRVPL